jgi:hypothetical protein
MNEDQIIIDSISKSKGFIIDQSISFFYFPNRDGSIRWIYPTTLKTPTFLNFYSSLSFKSKAFIVFSKLLFKLKLFNLIFCSKKELDIMQGSILSAVIENSENLNFSIFFGTVGPNRKVVFHIRTSNGDSSFLKYAISKESRALVDNEFTTLSKLKKLNPYEIGIPEIKNYEESSYIEVTNIKPMKFLQPLSLNKSYLDAIHNFNFLDSKVINWNKNPHYHDISIMLKKISSKSPLDELMPLNKIKTFLHEAKMKYDLLDKNKSTLCGLAHGDFTPWNTYLCKKNNNVHIFDWELSKINTPIFFDAFHFIFQSNILVKRRSYNNFKDEIKDLLRDLFLLIDQPDNRANYIIQSYIFYLLYISSYYINIYMNQTKLHEQAYWLIDSWILALIDLNNLEGDVF